MKVEEAQQFCADLAATESQRIAACLVSVRYRNMPGECAVKLQLLRARRIATIKQLADWPALNAAWSVLEEQ